MVTRAQMINMLKEAANAIMGTLTLVLQLSMNLIEMSPSQEEEEMPPVMSQHLEAMCLELSRQRNLLQEIVELQKHQGGGLMGSPGKTGHHLDPEEDSYSVISYGTRSIEPPTARPSQTGGAQHRPLAIAGIPLAQVPQVPVEGPAPAVSSTPMTSAPKPAAPAGNPLTLAQWGQKKIAWGKKHTGKTYYQTLCEDMGYLEWSRARYLSLPPPQQDFVDYCCAQLENDALMARQNVRNNQF